MIATISASTFDLEGHFSVTLAPDAAAASEITRRVSRSPTMDGGAAIYDAGFSDADRIVTLSWQQGSAEYEAGIARLLRIHARLVVSTRDGVFLAAPESYTPANGQSTMRLLVQQKLSS